MGLATPPLPSSPTLTRVAIVIVVVVTITIATAVARVVVVIILAGHKDGIGCAPIAINHVNFNVCGPHRFSCSQWSCRDRRRTDKG